MHQVAGKSPKEIPVGIGEEGLTTASTVSALARVIIERRAYTRRLVVSGGLINLFCLLDTGSLRASTDYVYACTRSLLTCPSGGCSLKKKEGKNMAHFALLVYLTTFSSTVHANRITLFAATNFSPSTR